MADTPPPIWNDPAWFGSVTIEDMPVVFDYECQVRDFLENRLPPSDLLFSRWQPQPIGHAATLANLEVVQPPYPDLPDCCVGELQWPSGLSRYARALYLVDDFSMQVIAKAAWGLDDSELDTQADRSLLLARIPTDWGPNILPLTVRITGEEQFSAQMYPLPPYRVPGDGGGLWLLPLVDVRFLWRQYTFNGTLPSNWSLLFITGANALGCQIEGTYGANFGIPDPLTIKEGSPWVGILDCAALSVGNRLVVDPATGMVRGISPASSVDRRAAMTSKTLVTAGGRGTKGFYPSDVKIVCRKANELSLACDDTIDKIGTLSAEGSYVHSVHSAWVVDYRITDTYTGTYGEVNGTATTDYVDAVAAAMVGWLPSGGQYAFAGPISYYPTGFDDYLSIEACEHEPGKYRFGSRVHELPPVFLPNLLLNQWASLTVATDIDQFTIIEEVTVDATGRGAWRGSLSKQVDIAAGETYKVGAKVWAVYRCGLGWRIVTREQSLSRGYAKFVLTSDLARTFGSTATATAVNVDTGASLGSITVLQTGQFRAFTGASGLCAITDFGYPIIFVNEPAPRILGVLAANPADSGGSRKWGCDPREATAYLRTSPAPYALTEFPNNFLSMTTDGDGTIHVDNSYRKFGEDGDLVICEWDPTYEKYCATDIMPQRQQQMWVALTADRSNGLAQPLTVDLRVPASHGPIPGTIEVADSYNVAINAKTGHHAFVVWDAITGKYRALESQHTATLVKATIASTVTGTPSSFTVTPVTGYDGITPGGTLTVQNRYGWDKVTADDPIDVRWDSVAGEWYPVQMKYSCS